MKIFQSFLTRTYRIVAMPAFVMGTDAMVSPTPLGHGIGRHAKS